MSKIYTQTRMMPARCRSARLRAAGVSPSGSAGVPQLSEVFKAYDYTSPAAWVYTPGGDMDHAVLIERGAWEYLPDIEDATPYYYKSFNPDTWRYESHAVWHCGVRWQCNWDESNIEPWVTTFSWELTDFFSELRIAIERDGDTVRARVFGAESGTELLPVSSIPARHTWVRVCEPPSNEDGAWNAEHADADGSVLSDALLDLPEGTTEVVYTYRMTMQVGGHRQSWLTDRSADMLIDAYGARLETEDYEVPERLKDSTGAVLDDVDGRPMFTIEEWPEQKSIMIQQSITINL